MVQKLEEPEIRTSLADYIERKLSKDTPSRRTMLKMGLGAVLVGAGIVAEKTNHAYASHVGVTDILDDQIESPFGSFQEYLELENIAEGSVVAPSAGRVKIFRDIADDILKGKNPDDSVFILAQSAFAVFTNVANVFTETQTISLDSDIDPQALAIFETDAGYNTIALNTHGNIVLQHASLLNWIHVINTTTAGNELVGSLLLTSDQMGGIYGGMTLVVSAREPDAGTTPPSRIVLGGAEDLADSVQLEYLLLQSTNPALAVDREFSIEVIASDGGIPRPLVFRMDGTDIITMSITDTLDFHSRLISNLSLGTDADLNGWDLDEAGSYFPIADDQEFIGSSALRIDTFYGSDSYQILGAVSDANPITKLGGALGLEFGPGGGSAVDVSIFRESSTIVKTVGDFWIGDTALYFGDDQLTYIDENVSSFRFFTDFNATTANRRGTINRFFSEVTFEFETMYLHQRNVGVPPAVADHSSLYAKDVSSSSELFGIDEAGNEVQLTSHNFEGYSPDPNHPYPWTYYAKNEFLGIEIWADMSGVVKEVEALSGKTFFHQKTSKKKSWARHQDDMALEIDQLNFERADEDENNRVKPLIQAELQKDIELTRREAIESVDDSLYEDEKDEKGNTLYDLTGNKTIDRRTGIVISERVVRRKLKLLRNRWRLKEGCNFNRRTGIFSRKKTLQEAIASIPAEPLDFTPYSNSEPLKWMKDRGVK